MSSDPERKLHFLALTVRAHDSVAHSCLRKFSEKIDSAGRVFKFGIYYRNYGWLFVQSARPRRECDGSETPLYLFLTRKNDLILRIFRVEVSETVFCIRHKISPADPVGSCSLDREISAQDSGPDSRSGRDRFSSQRVCHERIDATLPLRRTPGNRKDNRRTMPRTRSIRREIPRRVHGAKRER